MLQKLTIHNTAKSGKKYEKAIEWLVLLAKKRKAGNMEAWVAKTLPRAQARIKKYGINQTQIATVFERKGLTDLLPLINQ